MTVFKINFLECLQLDVSLFLLLKDDIQGFHIAKSFSHKYKLHCLLIFEY